MIYLNKCDREADVGANMVKEIVRSLDFVDILSLFWWTLFKLKSFKALLMTAVSCGLSPSSCALLFLLFFCPCI